MHRVISFLKAQALPLGMLSGFAVYLLFHWLPILNPLKPLADGANTYVLPIMVFVMLFTTFCKVNPAEMKFCRWHGIMLLLQLSVCLFIALILHFSQHIGHKEVVEGALVCLIAPSSYILWQNIVNSWQLWQKQKKEKKEQKNNVTISKK